LITVYIGLGTNLGDRAANLRAALAVLETKSVRITRASSLYETAPRDFFDQPWFLNQVVEAETALSPRELLLTLLAIERELGRERMIDKGPRLIDLDILLYADSIIDDDDLHIPHPRMTERRFVLEPLAELQPQLYLPSSMGGEPATVRDWLALVQDQQIRRV
jgi:2-amino-4-hydroxy-6-hydroxymethyldihydropteridine diphosphokinase